MTNHIDSFAALRATLARPELREKLSPLGRQLADRISDINAVPDEVLIRWGLLQAASLIKAAPLTSAMPDTTLSTVYLTLLLTELGHRLLRLTPERTPDEADMINEAEHLGPDNPA